VVLRTPFGRGGNGPRLVSRFALYTAVALALAGGGMFWFARARTVERARELAVEHTSYVADAILSHRLGRADFAGPVSPARRRALDRLFREEVLIDGSLRAKLWRADGLVTYSTDHSLIGTREPEEADAFHRILAGHPTTEMGHLNDEGGAGRNVKVVSAYVPVGTIGIAELYHAYEPIAADIRASLKPLAAVLVGALVLLWLSLFPILRRVTAALEARTRMLERTLAEREAAEDQLRQSQKMEAVGRLAGGVAHDFNNLLLAISGYSDFLLEGLARGSRLHGYAEEICRAADRAAGLTRQLLAFSRRQVLEPRVMSLNDALHETVNMLRRLLGADVELTTDLDPELAPIEADPGQINQVLLNLALNARDAMPEGGTIALRTRNAGDHVLLSVADTGSGMDVETMSHIFEPFFTTKEPGRGTGLGLSTVYGIVRQSGGTIDVETAPGAGTTFTVSLPRTTAAPAPAEAKALPAPRGRERVLLVEDADMPRRLVREMLERHGYEVECAPTPSAALALCASECGYDLLLTDVVMPKMTGVELAETLLARYPALRVVFMSGFTSHPALRPTVAEGMAFLSKPFSADELARKVRAVLDHSAATAA
jgi:signal transduction histidine kinase/ActR/RegA family two-component response regulator